MHLSPTLLLRSAALLIATLPAAAGLKVASNLQVLEWTSQLIAKEDYFNSSGGGGGSSTVSIVNGGVASLVGGDGSVDLGANAETQLLRQYATHRELRAVVTTAEVYYRIAASRRAGVASAADLRGKRIGALPGTSSEYFVRTYLAAAAGLQPSDYTIVPGSACLRAPCGQGTFPAMLRGGAVDAVALWEPTVQLAADALGAGDAVLLGGDKDDPAAYREIYGLATTARRLADPAARRDIVAFVRALVRASADFAAAGDAVVARAAAAVGVDPALLRRVWPVHRWVARVPPDLLDVLVREDAYVAALDRRPAMSRDVLAALVDTSVLEEALAGMDVPVTP